MTGFKAVKVETGIYEYRGFRIERVSDYDFTQMRSVTVWNIFENGCCDDTADTLRSAKYLVDRIIENRS